MSFRIVYTTAALLCIATAAPDDSCAANDPECIDGEEALSLLQKKAQKMQLVSVDEDQKSFESNKALKANMATTTGAYYYDVATTTAGYYNYYDMATTTGGYYYDMATTTAGYYGNYYDMATTTGAYYYDMATTTAGYYNNYYDMATTTGAYYYDMATTTAGYYDNGVDTGYYDYDAAPTIPPSQEFFMSNSCGRQEHCRCPSGSHIVDHRSDCSAAASALGASFHAEHNSEWPQGCYIYISGSFWFNSGPGGNDHPRPHPCMKTGDMGAATKNNATNATNTR